MVKTIRLENPNTEVMKIRQYVVDLIYRGGSEPQKVPSARKLAEMFGVSHPTALKALQKLAEGHVTRINFTEVVKRQFEIGDKFFAGHRDRFLSWIPFITKDDRTMEIYEKALKNAPCTTAAPTIVLPAFPS